MPHIRLSIQVDTEDEEPSRVIRKIEGTVFEYAGESEKEEQIGTLQCFLVQPGLAAEKGESLFEAMDSMSDTTMECYEALFDPDTDEWSDSVQELYLGGPISPDLLFIDRVELDERHRGKGIGRDVVKGIIETFGLHCGLIVCKPFALQYEGWAETYSAAEQADPGFEKRKSDTFGRVAKFWTDCGFVQMPDSAFYAHSPELLKQPDPKAPKASPRSRAARAEANEAERKAVTGVCVEVSNISTVLLECGDDAHPSRAKKRSKQAPHGPHRFNQERLECGRDGSLRLGRGSTATQSGLHRRE